MIGQEQLCINMSLSGSNMDLAPSSPPRYSKAELGPPSSPPRREIKERRNPSITPRKFRKFFTPRSLGPSTRSFTRNALIDITDPANNLYQTQSSPVRATNGLGEIASSPTFPRDLKRRKLFHSPDDLLKGENSLNSSALGERKLKGSLLQEDSSWGETTTIVSDSMALDLLKPVKRIDTIDSCGFAGQLLQMGVGSSPGGRVHRTVSYISDWRDDTSAFYSKPHDVYECRSAEGQEKCIPFCATSCNTNSLVAVGDEEGGIRLLDSSQQDGMQFGHSFLSFRPHTNAIIDMEFSSDDTLLATASGDQSAKIVDMVTQSTIARLKNNSASLKQVRFQPSGTTNNNIVATSSRDGSVQIWDLRCKTTQVPVVQIYQDGESGDSTSTVKAAYAVLKNSIYGAHRPPVTARHPIATYSSDLPSKAETPARTGDVSVTAIQFMPRGLEHLLLTASEADASVKLWDLRSLGSIRRKAANHTSIHLSHTRQPKTHSQWRHFGINSLNLSSDGSRLYTLCKDNTVYAYATSHLILGNAPDITMTDNSPPYRRLKPNAEEGLGPIHGYRHPKFHATSFYVKSAIRPAKDGKCEMLAVGSSNNCAILFPTDERHLKQRPWTSTTDDDTFSTILPRSARQPSQTRPPLPRRINSLSNMSSGRDLVSDVPISMCGTPLIRGHDKEVGSVAWTSRGDLVTVGDDSLVRCWREDANTARDLRVGGEAQGRRWLSGWADMGDGYDDDDEDF